MAVVAILLILGMAYVRSCYWKESSRGEKSGSVVRKKERSPRRREEIPERDIYTSRNIHDYIVYVIDHGSNGLGFPGGEMEGGYIDPSDSDMVACYVMELSGTKAPHPYPKEAEMFFSSVCAGCHGNDGKGLGGSYPDLTKKKLLGLERWLYEKRE